MIKLIEAISLMQCSYQKIYSYFVFGERSYSLQLIEFELKT